MTDRPTASTINDEQLDQLYEQLACAQRVAMRALDHEPTRRSGLRDEIAAALEAADYRMDMRRGDLADSVMPVLYREWPWLRVEAEHAAAGPRILCATTRPGHHTTICDLPARHGDHDGATGYGERVSWQADGTETTARVFAGLHQSAEQDVTRVINLYEQWVKAGPPIGVSMTGHFEWWREHLAELHDAILPTAEQPRTTANKPPTCGDAANNSLREQYAAIIRSECGSRFEYVTAQLLAVHQRDTAQLRRERDMALKAAREARGDVAHDAGPSVAECRDHDRAYWDVEQEAP